jgi:hypothetical protein
MFFKGYAEEYTEQATLRSFFATKTFEYGTNPQACAAFKTYIWSNSWETKLKRISTENKIPVDRRISPEKIRRNRADRTRISRIHRRRILRRVTILVGRATRVPSRSKSVGHPSRGAITDPSANLLGDVIVQLDSGLRRSFPPAVSHNYAYTSIALNTPLDLQ